MLLELILYTFTEMLLSAHPVILFTCEDRKLTFLYCNRCCTVCGSLIKCGGWASGAPLLGSAETVKALMSGVSFGLPISDVK